MMTYPMVDSGRDSINPTGLDGNFYLNLGNCRVVILPHRLYGQWCSGVKVISLIACVAIEKPVTSHFR